MSRKSNAPTALEDGSGYKNVPGDVPNHRSPLEDTWTFGEI